ncbi:sensor histidine kinase [Nocardioides pacificus]
MSVTDPAREQSLDEVTRIAQDLRAPLQAVADLAQQLTDAPRLDLHQRELTQRIIRAAAMIDDLADELVDSVMLERRAVVTGPVDIQALVDTVVGRHRMLPSPRGVVVRTVGIRAPAGAGPIVLGDAPKLERLLDLLVSNAVRFSPDGGDVVVGVKEDDGSVELTVADEGPGIQPSQQAAVFAPFYRTPDSVREPGVELGLAVVRQIAEKHAGSVRVDSAPGHGATFVVRLPLRPR